MKASHLNAKSCENIFYFESKHFNFDMSEHC